VCFAALFTFLCACAFSITVIAFFISVFFLLTKPLCVSGFRVLFNLFQTTCAVPSVLKGFLGGLSILNSHRYTLVVSRVSLSPRVLDLNRRLGVVPSIGELFDCDEVHDVVLRRLLIIAHGVGR